MDRAWIVAVVLCLSACGGQPATNTPHPTTAAAPLPPPPPPPPAWPYRDTDEGHRQWLADAKKMPPGGCEDVLAIREIPFKQVFSMDRNYNRVIGHFDHYRPCMVDALDDYTPLVEPVHLGPGMYLVDRSQLAHIMLVEGHAIEFDLCQPAFVLAKKEVQGALGFFAWLNESTAHRDQFTTCLQRELGRPGGKARPN